MTNGALKTGEAEARALADACHSREPAAIGGFAKALATKLEAQATDVAEFLEVLSLETDLPGKEYLGAVNVTQLVAPALEAIGVDVGHAKGCYERLVAEIARANRDGVGDPLDLLRVVADPRMLDTEAAHDRRLRRRRIDPDLVGGLVFGALDDTGQLTLAIDPQETPPPSRLRQKLEAGGLGPTAVDTAVELRASWYGFESRRRNDVPGGDPFFDDLRLRVLELVSLSESRVTTRKLYGLYAREMHVDVRNTVKVSDLSNGPTRFPLDDQLLQGLVFQLTDECKIWWSPRFELAGP